MARNICQGLLQSSKVMAHKRRPPSMMAYTVVFVVGVKGSITALSNNDPQYNFFASRLILPAWQTANLSTFTPFMQGAKFDCCGRAGSHRCDGGECVYAEQFHLDASPSDIINVDGTPECLQ